MVVTTTETKQTTVNINLQTHANTRVALAAAGAMLVVGILAAVSLGVAWMGTEFGGAKVSYGISELEMMGQSSSYGDASDGEADGVGMITTAYVLSIVATIAGFAAFLALGFSGFLQNTPLRVVAAALAAVATLTIMLATVFGPLGISAFHGDTFENAGGSLSWGAGLVLVIVASVVAIGGAVLGFMSLRKGAA